MTTPPQPPPVTPGHTAQPPAGDWKPPAPKNRVLPLLIVALVVSILAVVGLLAALLTRSDNNPAAVGATTTAAQPIAEDIPDATPATTLPPVKPQPKQFVLTPKITDKQCFGTAGCSVDLEVKMAYAGPELSTSDTWLVTYEVTGDESGPIIGSIEVTGDQYEVNTESLSTKSSKTKISIKVTEVEKVGL